MSTPRPLGADVRYSPDHLWLRRIGDRVTVGITDRIAGSLTLVNAVDLPSPGTELAANAELALIDAQKVALELPAPLAMHVVEVNQRLSTEPMLLRTDPGGRGWLLRCRLDRAGDWTTLLDETAYEAHVEGERQAIEKTESTPKPSGGRPHC